MPKGVRREAEVTVVLRSGREHGIVARRALAQAVFERCIESLSSGREWLPVEGSEFAWCVRVADIEAITITVVDEA